jgi:ubiquinone/menaquinone biosynthesis C-methylase UbiE
VNAERYDAWYDSPLGAFCFAKELDLVRRAMGDLADRSVLEVGCGTGRFLLSLGKNASKSVGVDRDQAMLDIARRHTPPTATSFRWIQADAVSLPFPDGTFDVVFESTLLCFQSDPARVIREMVRVCLSGGTIVLGELNPFSPWQLWRHAKGWLGDSTWHEARWNSSRALMRILSENSYRTILAGRSLFLVPVVSRRLFLETMEQLGRHLCPWLGAYYVVSAAKQRNIIAPVGH